MRARAVILMLLAGAGCRTTPELVILGATYGASCGQPAGNVSWSVASLCHGQAPCTFEIAPATFNGDPAEGCEKDFVVEWACGDGRPGARRRYEPARTSFRTRVVLTCD